MKILILGASGLIGSHLMQALGEAGCTVVGASRHRPAHVDAGQWCTLDFAKMTEPAAWQALLPGFDAVINCVGIIREPHPGDFDTLQRAAPVALFAACESLGIGRVVQISALGSAVDAATPYWRSKGAAELDLRRRKLASCIVRPSLVYGDEGASSQMFLLLATLPLCALPLAGRARVQPIHVDDLCAVLVKIITGSAPMPAEIATVGPRALCLADYLGALRQGMGALPGLVFGLPLWAARPLAWLAQWHPASALTPDALTMLQTSIAGGNTADAGAVSEVLGHAPRDPARFTRPALLPAIVMGWAAPLLRLALAFLWLFTAWVSWFGSGHAESMQWLGACGIAPSLQEPVLLGASVFDAVIGLALLLRPRAWLWPLQLLAVAAYTVIVSWKLPGLWLHPFGPVSKNLPLLALMLVLWRLEKKWPR